MGRRSENFGIRKKKEYYYFSVIKNAPDALLRRGFWLIFLFKIEMNQSFLDCYTLIWLSDYLERRTNVSTWQTATYCLILPHSDRCATTICLIGKFQGKKIGDCKPMSAIAFLLLCSFYRYGLCYSTFEVEVQNVIIPYHDYVHE